MTLAEVRRPSAAHTTTDSLSIHSGHRTRAISTMPHRTTAARSRASSALRGDLANASTTYRAHARVSEAAAIALSDAFVQTAQRRATPRQHGQPSSDRPSATADSRRRDGARQESHSGRNNFEEEEEELRHRRRQDDFVRARRQAHHDLDAQHELWSRHVQQRQTTTEQQQAAPPSATAPPAKPQHRVYLINCRSCDSFLTDRGMKAVLLLRPHITLYSTDAMPNCGPLHAPSRLTEPSSPHEPVVERTCDCLTQTLGCYGCGSAVGYHIVSPCDRCTSSVAKHQRSSNGHRTVLHCAEISVRERRYVPGEPGVRAAPSYTAWPLSTWSAQASTSAAGQQASRRTSYRPSSTRRHTSTRSTSALELDDEEFDDSDDDDDDEYDDDEDAMFDHSIDSQDKALREEQQQQSNQRDSRVMPAAIAPPPHPYRALRRGDTVFWSDLVPGGERATPIDADDHLSMPVAGR